MQTGIHKLLRKFSYSLMGFLFLFSVASAHSQTFDDAREEMLSGHRAEALSTLREIYYSKRDQKSQNLIENYSTQFLTQEGEGFYYQAINLIGAKKFAEAKERLDLANTKEPSHVLILMRLGQVETQLNLKEAAEEHLKTAIKLNPFHRDCRLLQAQLKWASGDEKEAFRTLESYKSYVLQNPVLLNIYLKMLKKLGKNAEIENIKRQIMSQGKAPVLNWVGLLLYAKLKPEETKLGKQALDKCNHDADHCFEAIEQNSKRTQFLWAPTEDLKPLLKDMVRAAR